MVVMAAAVRKLGFQKYQVREIFNFVSECYHIIRNLCADKHSRSTGFPVPEVAFLQLLPSAGYTWMSLWCP